MNPAILFAILSPCIWAAVNVFDKYLVEHKVKHTFGFSIVSGFVYIILGSVISIFLDWSGIKLSDMIFPILAGLFLGVQLYIYYHANKKADISYLIGIYYLYPIFVIILSILFLREFIPLIGYFGAILAISGAVFMSSKIRKINGGILWLITLMMLTGALSEFFVKISTNNISIWHGVALNSIAMGISTFPMLLNKKIRMHFFVEMKRIHFSFISEAATILAIAFLFLGMKGLPASVVSSLGAVQPLFVVIFEKIAHHKLKAIIKDNSFKFKIGSAILIVAGVIILTISSH